MNGNLLALGTASALAAAGFVASAKRGSRDEYDGAFFHVTEAENVPGILADGFVAGWGDVGFGIYFYGTYESARAYARKGGWDKKLRHPALLVVRDPRIRQVESFEIHGSWDASKYADMYVFDGDEDNEDAPIRFAEVVDEGPIPAKKTKKGSRATREPTGQAASSLLPGPWYHGRTSQSTAFDPAHTGDRWANNQDGPGFYFTSDPRDARTYAYPSGVVLQARLDPRKLVPHAGRVPAGQVDRLLRQAPDLADVLTNWDEDPRVAYRKLLAVATRQPTPWEAFLTAWGEAYRRAGDNAAWMAGMVALGYDGVVSPSSWGVGEDGQPVQHVVVFNPERIRDVEVIERRGGANTRVARGSRARDAGVILQVALPDAIRRNASNPDFVLAWPSFRPHEGVTVVDDRHGNMLEILAASGGKVQLPLSTSDAIRAWQKLSALHDYFGKLRFPLRVYRGVRMCQSSLVAVGGPEPREDDWSAGRHWTVNRQIARRFATGEHDAANFEPDYEREHALPAREVLLAGVIQDPADVDWHRTLTDYLVYTLGSEDQLNVAEEQVHSARVTSIRTLPVTRVQR